MTDTRLWDRAALAIVPDEARRVPAVPTLASAHPTVAELFEFMRDAELRFATLMLRLVERSGTTRGEDATQIDVVMRHPGHDKPSRRVPGRPV